jgi:hypothetical protein
MTLPMDNVYAVESRSFDVERLAISDGYEDNYNIFDGYSVIITENGSEADPVLVPICLVRSYGGLVAKMESEMSDWHRLPYDERRYYLDKYDYYKSLYDALRGV